MVILHPKLGGEDNSWFDGAPLWVPSEIVLIDIRIYRRMVCPGCGKSGMKAVPQHQGDNYRILCSCRMCRHQEAV